jgi:hypothetical protein
VPEKFTARAQNGRRTFPVSNLPSIKFGSIAFISHVTIRQDKSFKGNPRHRVALCAAGADLARERAAEPFLTSTRSPCICSTCALIRPAVCISWSRRAKLDRYETDFVGFKRAYISIWEKSGLFRYPWQLHRTLAEPYECSWSEYQLHLDRYLRPDSSTSGAGRDRQAGSERCEFQTIDEQRQKITDPSKTGADNSKCGDQDQLIQPPPYRFSSQIGWETPDAYQTQANSSEN